MAHVQEFVIQLNDVKFFSRHGVYKFERERGNDFIVNLEVRYSIPESYRLKDRLENTICYASLYEIIKREMEKPRSIMETVAFTITDNILKEFSWVSLIECRITKLNPPIEGFDGTASVSYRWRKEERKDEHRR